MQWEYSRMRSDTHAVGQFWDLRNLVAAGLRLLLSNSPLQ